MPKSQEKPSTDMTKPETSPTSAARSEEHTSELQSQSNLVCRLLLGTKDSSSQDEIRAMVVAGARVVAARTMIARNGGPKVLASEKQFLIQLFNIEYTELI